MKSLTVAVPKGRILKELLPLFEKAKIIPEKDFLNSASRKLLFKTNLKGLNLIKVRSFDVATFVAIGAAQIGVAGDDVIEEFNYEEIYSTLDLKIGKCRLSIASKETKDSETHNKQSHIMVATKYKNIVTNFFAQQGIRAECIKLNGAVELAPKLGICSTIVDLVSSGNTLKENNLKETKVLMNITSKLIINKIAYKLLNNDIRGIITKITKVVND